MIEVKNLKELLVALGQDCEVKFDGAFSLSIQDSGICDYAGVLVIYRIAELYSVESFGSDRPVFSFQFFGGSWQHYVPKSHQSTDMVECARADVKLASSDSSLDAVVSLYVK